MTLLLSVLLPVPSFGSSVYTYLRYGRWAVAGYLPLSELEPVQEHQHKGLNVHVILAFLWLAASVHQLLRIVRWKWLGDTVKNLHKPVGYIGIGLALAMWSPLWVPDTEQFSSCWPLRLGENLVFSYDEVVSALHANVQLFLCFCWPKLSRQGSCGCGSMPPCLPASLSPPPARPSLLPEQSRRKPWC